MNDVNGSSKNDKKENAAIHFTQERNLFSESNPTSSAQNLPGEIYVSEANGAPDVYHLSNLPKLVPMDKDNKKLSTYDRLTGSSYWILFWLCWASFVQGLAVNGFINTSVTTIERRYNLKSADAGFFAAMYDVGSVLFSVPVSYLGSRAGASKPKWISIGIFLMCMGSFVYTIPHFASPMYEAARQTNVRDVFLCHSGSNATSLCKEKGERWISNFRYVFIFGQFLHGVGASPLYTLGITYLHESFSLNSASLYLAIFYSVAIIGPACGYVVGGAVLVRTIKPAFSGYSQKISVSISAVLLLLHTVLALGFMLYFFYPPNPSNITATVSVTPLPNVLKNGTLLEKTRILNEKEKKIDGMQSLSLKKSVHGTEINKTEISKRNKIKDDNIKAEDENSKTDVKNNGMSKTNVDNENGLSKGDSIKDEKRIIRSDTDIKDKTGKSKSGEIKNENEISKLGGKDENGSISESAIENKNRITEKNETKDENEMSKKSEIKNENRINGTDSTLKINTEKINNRSGK